MILLLTEYITFLDVLCSLQIFRYFGQKDPLYIVICIDVKISNFINRKSLLDPESIRSLKIEIQIDTAVSSISIGLGLNSGPEPHRLRDTIIDLSPHTQILVSECAFCLRTSNAILSYCMYVFLLNSVDSVVSLSLCRFKFSSKYILRIYTLLFSVLYVFCFPAET